MIIKYYYNYNYKYIIYNLYTIIIFNNGDNLFLKGSSLSISTHFLLRKILVFLHIAILAISREFLNSFHDRDMGRDGRKRRKVIPESKFISKGLEISVASQKSVTSKYLQK